MQQQPQRFPRWLSWIVLIGLGYIVFIGNTTPRQGVPPMQEPTEASVPSATEDYPTLKTMLDGDRWAKAINPDYKGPNDACSPPKPEADRLGSYAVVRRDGEGQPLGCQQSSGFRITRWGNDGKGNKPFEAELKLGEQPAFDALVIGMRIGEQRLLILRLPERTKTLPTLPPRTQLLLDVERLDPVVASEPAP